jgi:YfiH family protein
VVSTADGETFLESLRGRIDPAVRDRFQVTACDSLPLLVVRTPERFLVAFTTRWAVAGASRDPLDLSRDPQADPATLDPGESPARVALRQALSTLSGRPGPRPVTPQQVHGVRVAGVAEYVGSGVATPCDGLTVQPGLDDGLAALLVFADCVPVVLMGEVDAAVVHGGWRGLLAGVVQQGAAAMTAPPGLAVIGPSIGPCCYEVSQELADDFARRFGEGAVPSHRHLDLWEVATMAAAEVGVPRERVLNPRLCTVCNSEFFYSYRCEGEDAGRHGAILWCPGESSGEVS